MKKLFTFLAAALMSVSVFAVKDVVPTDAVLADYYNYGDVCVCFYVPAEMNCNNIVLTGSFNGWKSTAAECVAVEPVEGYDGWYVGSFAAEAEPDAERGMQAKPIMLDVDGRFNWDYQVGAATVIRGCVQVVQGAYAGEIDLLNYCADAPNVFTVDAWKQNPCTAIYHNYTVTVINDGCNGLTIPFIVGDMTSWAFQQMQLDMAKTQEYQTAVYNYSFKAAEGTAYQIVSGMMDPQTGLIDSTQAPGWMDIAYMQKLVDGQWVRLPGEEYDNQLTHEEANIVWDLRADTLRWARCAPAEPEEYVVLAVNLPVLNCPQAVEVIGSFDDWAGTAMEKLNTGWYFVQLEAKASQYFKLRSAGSWDTELEIYDAENDEWRPVQDNQFVFGQLWQDDTYKGTPCKWIELDLSDPEKYRWSYSKTVHLATVANYIDFQALSVSDPQMVQSVVTSTNPYTLPNGTVLRGFQKSDGTEAENRWNVATDYTRVFPTPEWEGVDSLKVGTAYRAASRTTIELGAFNLQKASQMIVYFQPNGDSDRGISVSILGRDPIEYIRSGVKIDGIRPAYAAPFDLPAGNYDAGDVVIQMVNNTSNIYGIGIQDVGYTPEPEEPEEPEEYVVLAVNLPVLNCPQAVEVIGNFDDWQGTAMEKLQTGWYFVQLEAKASQYFNIRSAGSWDKELEIYDAENNEWKPVQDNQLVFGQLWQDDTYKGTPCKWIELDLSDPEYYRWSVSDDPSVNPGPFAISVTDNSLDDWKNLPSSYVAKAYCPSNASMTALKSVKVFADQTYINILVEPDMSKLPDLEWVPFHVFIDTDNSDITGGYGDEFLDPNTDIMLETAVFAEGQPYSYNPAVFKWWGEVGGEGWQWIDPSVEHTGDDNWGAIVGEGQLPIGNSQFVNGKIEIQLLRELIPANWNMNEFGIGFDIQQYWSSVGVLPCANATDGNPSGKAAKLKVKVHPSSPLVPIVNREVVIDGIKYYLNGEDTTATVIYKDGGYYDAIIIPAQVSYSELTYKVVAIGSDAFNSCRGLTSVTIPNSVTSIGDWAFGYCNSLTSIEIPNSVTSIGYAAFRYCSGLTSLEIPNSVKNCGGNLFGGCTNLNSIIAPADAFVNSWEYPIRLEHIRITAGLMQYDAFYWIADNASALKTIDLAAVENTELQDNLFNNCYSLQKLVLPSNLTRINYMAIAQCIHLNSIAIPAGVTEIGDRAFEDCRSLAKVEFAGTNLQRIGDWAFYNCHELSQINLPEGVTEIGKAAFYGCVYANQAYIPASVQAIGDNAFALCSKLSKMIVDAVVPPTVEDKTFYEVSTTAPVYVPANSVEDYKSHPVWGKLNIIGNAPEGVENVQSDQVQCTKVIENGVLYLKYNGTKYNVQGTRVK